MSKWIIQKDTDVRKYWAKLEDREEKWREAFEEAERILSEKPYTIDHDPGVIKHLKGGYKCNHEYRKLPNAQRIFYKIWTRKDIEAAILKKQAGVPVVDE